MVSVNEPNEVSFRLFIFVLVIKPREYTVHRTLTHISTHIVSLRLLCTMYMDIKFVFLVLYFGRYNMITRGKLTICLGLQHFHRITCYNHNYTNIDSSINTSNKRTSRSRSPTRTCRPHNTLILVSWFIFRHDRLLWINIAINPIAMALLYTHISSV